MSETAEKKSYGTLETAFRKVEEFAAVIAGILMVLSMFLTAADALTRYTIGSVLTLSFYLNEKYILVGMLCLPLAWGLRQGGYIRFVAILGLLSSRSADTLLRLGLLVGCAYVVILAYLAGGQFVDAYVHNDIDMGVIDWPVAWSWAPVPVGLALLAVRIFLIAFGSSEGLRAGEELGDEL